MKNTKRCPRGHRNQDQSRSALAEKHGRLVELLGQFLTELYLYREDLAVNQALSDDFDYMYLELPAPVVGDAGQVDLCIYQRTAFVRVDLDPIEMGSRSHVPAPLPVPALSS